MSRVAVHKPEALDGFIGVWGKAQFHQVGQTETENMGKELDGGVKVGRRQYCVAHTHVAGDKLPHTNR